MRIFLCYRRSESASAAAALKSALESADGSTEVFLDTVSGKAGEEFPTRLEHEIEQADAVVVLIGPEWEKAIDRNDWVRREIAYAYSNGIPVVPLTHGSGSMPSGALLPRSIRKIASQNALHLPDQRMDGVALTVAVKSHLSRSTVSTSNATGVGAWIWGYLSFPFAPIAQTKALSRGGLATLISVGMIVAILPTSVASICYSGILNFSPTALFIAVVGSTSLLYVIVVSVILGLLLNAVALAFGGSWRPVRAAAGASIFVSWYYTMTLFIPFAAIYYLKKVDPSFENFIFLMADADSELALDLLDTYMSGNPYAESVIRTLVLVATVTSFYAACMIRATLAFLRVRKVMQWIVAVSMIATIWLLFFQ